MATEQNPNPYTPAWTRERARQAIEKARRLHEEACYPAGAGAGGHGAGPAPPGSVERPAGLVACVPSGQAVCVRQVNYYPNQA